ncbi:MAG: hypothetical protein IMW89_02760 [Ktedonobacteraceae bacterium]|nr:hypothetical protein [Ktedonobacteraceae bacterium]
MIKVMVDYMMGPLGRSLEAAYLDHGVQASLLVLAWMVVVFIGLRGVARMRRLLRLWVAEVLPHYDFADSRTPEQILLALEPRWNAAASQVRFMPGFYGLWIQRATPDGLRSYAGFTREGVNQLIMRITGHRRATALETTGTVRSRSTRTVRKKH